ncbi:hypothetical protein HAX54_039001 [Datura stramonium]|uniref:Uncharacterized protein n=1 Tax=Datura stramonium TaxID=4076 RepID=A0ABS8VM97_DATST|nr:hypothetical protein [Datura stramonium]
MAPKVNKWKGMASSSHRSKRVRRPSEEEHEDVRMTPPPLRRYRLHWVTKQEDRILTLDLGFVFDVPGDCNLNMEEEADYRPDYDPRGIEVTKKKEPEGINGLVLSVNERNVRIDNILSHLYGIQILQLRMNGLMEEQLQQLNIDYPLREHSRAFFNVCLGYEEPFDDDVAKKDEMARVESDLVCSDDNEEDSEMGEAAPAPTDDEE